MNPGATDASTLTVLAGLIIAIGLAGVVVPFLPGLPLVWGGVLLWALGRHDVEVAIERDRATTAAAGQPAGQDRVAREANRSGVPLLQLEADAAEVLGEEGAAGVRLIEEVARLGVRALGAEGKQTSRRCHRHWCRCCRRSGTSPRRPG